MSEPVVAATKTKALNTPALTGLPGLAKSVFGLKINTYGYNHSELTSLLARFKFDPESLSNEEIVACALISADLYGYGYGYALAARNLKQFLTSVDDDTFRAELSELVDNPGFVQKLIEVHWDTISLAIENRLKSPNGTLFPPQPDVDFPGPDGSRIIIKSKPSLLKQQQEETIYYLKDITFSGLDPMYIAYGSIRVVSKVSVVSARLDESTWAVDIVKWEFWAFDNYDWHDRNVASVPVLEALRDMVGSPTLKIPDKVMQKIDGVGNITIKNGEVYTPRSYKVIFKGSHQFNLDLVRSTLKNVVPMLVNT